MVYNNSQDVGYRMWEQPITTTPLKQPGCGMWDVETAKTTTTPLKQPGCGMWDVEAAKTTTAPLNLDLITTPSIFSVFFCVIPWPLAIFNGSKLHLCP